MVPEKEYDSSSGWGIIARRTGTTREAYREGA
jgi:hypothetical protein